MIMRKHGFTLVEIVMVLIIIGILLVLVPLNLRGVENHVQLSLITQKIEDNRDAVSIRMRQGRIYDTAILGLTTTGWNIAYSGGIQGERKAVVVFEKKIQITKTGSDNQFVSLGAEDSLQRKMGSYGISCEGRKDLFRVDYQGMQACYQVDLNSCILKRMKCNK